MNSTNSKITRVQPVFSWLRQNGESNWPDRFLQLVTGIAIPIKAGKLLLMDLEQEREVAASPARLAWMLRNGNRLAPKDGHLWLELKHRISDTPKVEAALKLLERGETQGLGKQRLEGQTHADCLLECEHALVWIEGKRFDWISPSITWDVSRDQLARNLEAVWMLAGASQKNYCVVICHEHRLKHHEQALIDGYRGCTWSAGWPHIPAAQRLEFSKRIGTVTWQTIATEWPPLGNLPQIGDLGQEPK